MDGVTIAATKAAVGLTRARATTVLVGLAVLACAAFILSAWIGGVTWDEGVHRRGAILQFQVGGDWLAGKPTSFTVIPGDLAFYGTVPVGLVAGVDAAWTAFTGTPLPARTYGILLHAIAFALTCIAGLLVFDALRRQSRSGLTPWIGAAFLMLYPLWLGYGFFDYKDGPTAFFVLLLVYCSGRALENNGRDLARWTAVAALATIALGGTKLAALSLGVVPWVALAAAALRGRRWAVLPLAALGVVAGLIIITPASWPAPLAFSKAAVELMSRHPWPGCIVTNGACIGPSQPDWSAASYLRQWAVVQLPLIAIVGLPPALAAAIWLGGFARIAAGTLILSIAAIVVKNASLYDGLRHVLFAVPLIVIVLFVAIDWAITAWGRIARVAILALVAIELTIFAIDDVRMFPYNYVYFNLAARGGIDTAKFETEYWGFSLHEAVTKAQNHSRGLKPPVVADVPHLVAASLPDADTIAGEGDFLASGYKGSYTLVRLSRGSNPPPKDCRTIAEVARSLLGGPPLLLSYVVRCKME